MNPAVHSWGGSEECVALLGVPFLYKILRVGYISESRELVTVMT